MLSFSFGSAAALLLAAASHVAAAPSASSLPIVDLGYERYQAIGFNQTGQFYNFSNIRYAQPPLGDLRFAAPVPPQGRSSKINTGSVGAICPQANPAWLLVSQQFVPAYLTGQPYNVSMLEAEAAAVIAAMQIPPQDPSTSEDCLFLDVYSPKKVFSKQVPESGKGGAPVMVWIHGGGYTGGSKNQNGVYNPAGLIKSSRVGNQEGVIVVALNYRLGALGWLSGPTLQSSGGTAQPGLYDQRLGLEWVQSNIHLFGGDKSRVTVFGESAGGGSIMHQLTAFSGLKGPAPFQQAILQSPAWIPVPGAYAQETAAQTFFKYANVSTLAEARALSSEAVQRANILTVAQASFGSFVFGPVVDGVFAPALPGQLLAAGAYYKDVKVMVGHNADEGLAFTDPSIANTTDLVAALRLGFPGIADPVLAYITETLYPAVYDGSFGYQSAFQRAVLVTADFGFTCNTQYLDRAYAKSSEAYAYQFSVGPALHGQDVPYTWFNGPNAQVVNDGVATEFQQFLTSFAESGNPNSRPLAQGVPLFPLYSGATDIVDLEGTGIGIVKDPTANARCAWWQKALYY